METATQKTKIKSQSVNLMRTGEVRRMYKIMITGSRKLKHVSHYDITAFVEFIKKKVAEHGDRLLVVCGDADGFDLLAVKKLIEMNVLVIVCVCIDEIPRISSDIFDSGLVSWCRAPHARTYTARDDFMMRNSDELFAFIIDSSPGSSRNVITWKDRFKKDMAKGEKPVTVVEYETKLIPKKMSGGRDRS